MAVIPAASPAKFLHGDNGQITITIATVETEFQVTQADFTVETVGEDIPHSGANGWNVKLAGLRSVNGTLTYVYDLANAPAAATPYKLQIGTFAAVKIYGNAHQSANLSSGDANSSEAWAGPAFIKNQKFKTGPKAGAMEVTCDFESSGAWTGPGIS